MEKIDRRCLKSERVAKLKANFIQELHDETSYANMAKKYGVCIRSVYNIKDEIAKELNVNPRTLLYYPKSLDAVRESCSTKEPVDVDQLLRDIEKLSKDIAELQDSLSELIS